MDDSPRVAELRRRLEEATAGLQRQRRELEAVRRGLETATSSSTSRDHTVTVTVGARGDVASLHFHGTRYRALPPAELEHLIVETIAAARAHMAARVSEAFQPYLPAGSPLAPLMAGADADPFANLGEA
jgi:hypothetical protein